MNRVAQSLRYRFLYLMTAGLLAFLVFAVKASGLPAGPESAFAQAVLPVSAGGPYSGTVGVPVTFSASTSGAVNPQFSWTFGDGTFGSGQVTTHGYSTANVFSVSVTVSDPSVGRSGSASTTATISGNSNCIPGVNVPIGTNCTNNTNCIPGVNVPIGTNCSNSTNCIPGVTVAVGTICPNSSFCSTGVLCPSGTVPFTTSGSSGSTATRGCMPGMPPCGAGVTCIPIGANSVSCSSASPTPIPAALSVASNPITSTTGSTTTPLNGLAGATLPPVTIDSLAAGAAAPSSPATLVPSPSPAPGVPVIYPAGWNIIGGPAGLMLPAIASGPFAFPPGATAYVVPAAGQMLQAGLGYWVLFNAQTPVSLPLVAGQPVTVQLPAGQYVLIGNPNDTAATVTGADSVLVYDPIAGAYQQTSTLAPGQGAWAISSAGGLATISPTATSPTTVPPTTTSPTPTGPVTVPPATTNPATP